MSELDYLEEGTYVFDGSNNIKENMNTAKNIVTNIIDYRFIVFSVSFKLVNESKYIGEIVFKKLNLESGGFFVDDTGKANIAHFFKLKSDKHMTISELLEKVGDIEKLSTFDSNS